MFMIRKNQVVVGKNIVRLPVGSQILSVQLQNGSYQLWSFGNDLRPLHDRVVDLYMTGQSMPEEPGRYISTVLSHEDSFVVHAFDSSKI